MKAILSSIISLFFFILPALADELEPIAIPLPSEISRSLSDLTMEYDPNEPATITVLVVYTAQAEAWALYYNGGIQAIIDNGMEYAQVTADNSQSGITFNIVGTMRTSYVESGDSSIDLQRITSTTDGYMDEVHKVRDEYGADLVVLFAKVDDVGGVGWLMSNPSGNSKYGFCLVRVQQAAGSSTVHEMGHNLGMHHHKDQNYQPGPGIFSYSAGGRWVGSDGQGYCSVMTYTGGTYFADGRTHSRIPIFSSPQILHLGMPTGSTTNADNARTAREMKHVIASYRAIPGSLVVTLNPSNAKWRRKGDTIWHNNGEEVAMPIGVVIIEFSDVRGWVMPKPITVEISESEVTEIKVEYEIETCIVLVIPSAGGQVLQVSPEVKYCEVVVYKVIPNNGYSIGSISGCGGTLSGDIYTTEPLTEDCTITASFIKNAPPAKSSSSGGGGCFVNSLIK